MVHPFLLAKPCRLLEKVCESVCRLDTAVWKRNASFGRLGYLCARCRRRHLLMSTMGVQGSLVSAKDGRKGTLLC